VPNFDTPTFNQQPGRPPIQLQLRDDIPVDIPQNPQVFETKFKPQVRRTYQDDAKVEKKVEVVGELDEGPIFRETPKPAEIQIPQAAVSISDEISGEEVNGVFAEVNGQKSNLF